MNDSNQSLGLLLQQVAASLARFNDEILLDRLEIGMAQFKVLCAVEVRPYVQQKYIARALGQTEASVSRQIKLMDRDGLVKIITKPGDRREHVVSLTPRGQRIVRRAQTLLNSHHRPLLSNIPANQQRALLNALQTLNRNLG